MSKYSALPDLDTQPDVYETPDQPSELNSVLAAQDAYADENSYPPDGRTSESEADEGLVRSSLSVSSAHQRFSSINAPAAAPPDFSGTIARTRRSRRRHHHHARATVGGALLPDQEEYAIIGSTAGARGVRDETTVEKLRRLMFEVAELGRQIEAEKAEEEKENVDAQSQGADGATAATPAHSRKAKQPTPAQLLEQVALLQRDMGGMERVLIEPPEISGGSGRKSAGSQAVQLQAGKALIAQLKSLRHPDISEDVASALPSSEVKAAHPPSGGDPYITYELFYTPETAKLAELAKLTQVESRLAALERLIGTHFLQGLEGPNAAVTHLLNESGSLIGALHRLDSQLALLTQPRQLDAVAKRVQQLTVDADRLAELRRKQNQEHAATMAAATSTSVSDLSFGALGGRPSSGGGGGAAAAAAGSLHDLPPSAPAGAAVTQTESERRVNALYALMEKLDPVAGIVPHLVARLRALRSLHAEAAIFAESLDVLSNDQARMKESVRGVETAISMLETSLKVNEESVAKNVDALQSRMERLSERVDALIAKTE
ncbi:hypothetical protein HDU86_006542 [Geranomyces michiganensis]|nr:hypothetical protein HDU86_006542 [Geranomyces michiganensis]